MVPIFRPPGLDACDILRVHMLIKASYLATSIPHNRLTAGWVVTRISGVDSTVFTT
ncbi:MAG: hypothetical protein JO165_08495 [Candidatus Eremiobacteraeota bacterium]|nr:hypothetical protein [Candidatus Eremiobacteraeota bacterium]